MWVQTGGPPDKPVILFNFSTSRAQEVPLRLLDDYRGYLMTDDYSGYNAVAAQPGSSVWAAWLMPGASSSTHRKCNSRVRPAVPTSR